MPASPERRVLLALSGGVDSSVCASLLMRQGYSVHAAVIRFSPLHEKAVEAARRAAEELNLPLAVLCAQELFEREVVAPFCRTYAAGRTPNPCVLCNPLVKFKLLAQEADRLGIHNIASGHYANVEQENDLFYVSCAASVERDQSYMLYRLPQNILQRLLLPLGIYQKQDIRQMAAAAGLSSAESPDSQEICFVPDKKHADFVAARCGHGMRGNFIGPNGENLGAHRGVVHYTVGQRRGLGLALGKPVFIREILPGGDIALGLAGQEYAGCVFLEDVVSAGEHAIAPGSICQVKIRSTAPPAACRVVAWGQRTELCFETPQRAAAPGQSAVLYRNGRVIGGGIIAGVQASASQAAE